MRFSFAKISAVLWNPCSPCYVPCCWLPSHLCQGAGREQPKVTISIPRATEVFIILMTARNILSSFDPLSLLLFFIVEESPQRQTLCNLTQKSLQVCSLWGLPAILPVNLSGNCAGCGHADTEKTCGRPSSLCTATGEISPGLFV